MGFFSRLREKRYAKAVETTNSQKELYKIVLFSYTIDTRIKAIERLEDKNLLRMLCENTRLRYDYRLLAAKKCLTRSELLAFIALFDYDFGIDRFNELNMSESELKELIENIKYKIIEEKIPSKWLFNRLLVSVEDNEILERFIDDENIFLDTKIKIAKRYYSDRFDLLSFLVVLQYNQKNDRFLDKDKDKILNEISHLNPTDDEYKKLSKIHLQNIIKECQFRGDLSDELFVSLMAHTDDKELLKICEQFDARINGETNLKIAKLYYGDDFNPHEYFVHLSKIYHQSLLSMIKLKLKDEARLSKIYDEIKFLNPTQDKLEGFSRENVQIIILDCKSDHANTLFEYLTDQQALTEVREKSKNGMHKLIAARKTLTDSEYLEFLSKYPFINPYDVKSENAYFAAVSELDKADLFFFGQRFRSNYDSAFDNRNGIEILKSLIHTLKSNGFVDGLFSKGDIEYAEAYDAGYEIDPEDGERYDVTGYRSEYLHRNEFPRFNDTYKN